MKILRILFIVIVSLVVIFVAGLFIFIKVFDISHYKPFLMEQASQALGRPVDIKNIHLDFSLQQGINVQIQGLSVRDAAAGPASDFFTVDKISAGLDVMRFWAERKVMVSSVDIFSPRLNIVRNKQGQINLAPAPPTQNFSNTPTAAAEQPPASGVPTLPAPPAGGNKSAAPPVLIDNIRLQNGMVSFKDETQDPALVIDINKISVAAGEFSFDHPFFIKAQAAVLSANENLSIETTAVVNPPANQVRLEALKLVFDLSRVSLPQLEALVPVLKEAGLAEGHKGNLTATAKEITATLKGPEPFLMSGTLADVSIPLKFLSVPILGSASFQFNLKDFTLEKLTAQVGSGTAQMSAQCNDYLGQQIFNIEGNLKDISAAESINQKALPVRVEGKLLGNFKASGQGFTPEAFYRFLQGSAALELKEGKLVDFNFLRTVFSQISMVPGLLEKMESSLPENYKSVVQQKDTVIKTAKLSAQVEKAVLVISRMEVAAEGFKLTGSGTVDWNQKVSLGASLIMEPDLSASIIAGVPELQYILDEEQQIRIPVRVSGRIPRLSVIPDLEYLGKKIFVNRGRQELEKVLDKVFKKSESSPGSESGAPAGEKSTEQKAIQGILDSIFK